MNLFDKQQRLQQRIAELTAGKEIDAKHIKVLLSEERQIEFDAEWRRQQALRKRTKPTALNTYETLHRQAAALLARCGSAAAKTKAEQTALNKLRSGVAPPQLNSCYGRAKDTDDSPVRRISLCGVYTHTQPPRAWIPTS